MLKAALEMADEVWENPKITKGRTQATFKDIDGVRWITFDATDSLEDILDHIQFWPTKFEGSWVHTGWLNAYKRVRSWVQQTVKEAKCPVVFSGHSLGGAIAQIACLDMGFGPAITTGSPRPFFGKAPKIDVIRFETEDDPVCKLPPGYKGAGQEIILKVKTRGWSSHFPQAYKGAV